MQPISSFFPQGFLMSPDCVPLVDANHILFAYFLSHLHFCFRGSEGVSLCIEITCIYPYLYIGLSHTFLSQLILSLTITIFSPTHYSFSIIPCLIYVWVSISLISLVSHL
jgi:hypothetical protein